MVFNECGQVVNVKSKMTLVEYVKYLSEMTGKTLLEIADDIVDDKFVE